VGIKITPGEDKIRISQTKYIESVLTKEGMANAYPVGMLMDLQVKIGPNPDICEPNWSNSYAQLVGELQYITNGTRLDISYAVNKLAAYTVNPSAQHYGALK
jgi:hypothetical protein